MASKAHQFIANMLAVKMRQLNFEVVSFDGTQIFLSEQKLPIPPCLKRHRPDILGYDSKSKTICIGEAKTTADLNSERTKEQIADYASIITKSEKPARILLGVPSSGLDKLNLLLGDLELAHNPNLIVIHVPDRLLPK